MIAILGGHCRDDALTADRIRTAIRVAEKRDVEFPTLREVLVRAGVVDGDAPTSTLSRSPIPTSGTSSNDPESTDPTGHGGDWFASLDRVLGSVIDRPLEIA